MNTPPSEMKIGLKVEVKNKGIKDWQPKVIAFLCQRGPYLGADQAGLNRLPYSSNLSIIRIPCFGRVDPLFLLKAFEKGADGVLIARCHQGDCGHPSHNYQYRKNLFLFQSLLEFCGFDTRRIHFSCISKDEGVKWSNLVNEVVSLVREAGPFPTWRRQEGERL
jgi:F420-non-reducing hydrogenase iron-sulfur subunit